jgi:uncharacterized protein YecE (DUF72 family)
MPDRHSLVEQPTDRASAAACGVLALGALRRLFRLCRDQLFLLSLTPAGDVRWRDSTPPNFAFAVKVPRAVTHDCALRGCERELSAFLEEVTGLGAKLGVLLVQLPPSFEFDGGVVRAFFENLEASTPCAIACEPRHATWFTPEVESLLEHVGVARVAADPPRGAAGARPRGSPELAYYRLHGTPEVYYSAYGNEFLAELADELQSVTPTSPSVWCVFDNTARHESWRNACELRALMEQRSYDP